MNCKNIKNNNYNTCFNKIYGFSANHCYYKLYYRILPNNHSAVFLCLEHKLMIY